MTSYWNWASVEAEIWSRVSYLPSKFSICSLISLKSEKRIIIYLQWRNERCGLIEVFKTEWPRQPCYFPYIALLPGLCHVFTGVLQDWPILNLARDDVTNPWLLIRLRSPWNFWPQLLDLSLASQYYVSYHQGTTHIIREERGRWLLPSYMFVNLFVIYTGDPRRSNGDQPPVDHGLFLWEVIWGIMTSSFLFYYCTVSISLC